MRIWRMILGLMAAGLAALSVGCQASNQADTVRDQHDVIVEAGEVGVFSVRVGDCLQSLSNLNSLESVIGVPCGHPHQAEVYDSFALPDGDFPGEAVVDAEADNGCLARFEEFVGQPYATSEYDIVTMFPTEESWRVMDDRQVLCLVVRVDGHQKRGSARASGEQRPPDSAAPDFATATATLAAPDFVTATLAVAEPAL